MTKAFVMVAAAGLAGSAMAQGGTSFGTATNWAGPQTVTGAFTAAVTSEALIFSRDFTVSNANSVASFTTSGLTAGNAYRAVTSAASGGGSYDTRLRVRNSSGTTLGENDDFSGVFSRVTGTVPGDGTLQVQGTWWQNTTWNAATSITPGSFNMALYAVTITTPGVSTQWYRFSGLGGTIQADVLNLSAGGDTVLAMFNSSGTILGFDDDSGDGLASSLGVASPNDGVVYVAVSSYNGLAGQETNAYYDNRITNTSVATFDLRVVPTPGSLALLGLGGLLAGRRRR
ncbi:MAG: hypothetical protein HEQ23_14810 [Tepidisphaera sp.]